MKDHLSNTIECLKDYTEPELKGQNIFKNSFINGKYLRIKPFNITMRNANKTNLSWKKYLNIKVSKLRDYVAKYLEMSTKKLTLRLLRNVTIPLTLIHGCL